MKNKYSIYQKGHSIISPLACGSSANFEAIAAGKSQLRSYGRRWGIPEPFFASVFEDDNSFGDIVPPKVEMSHGTFPQYTRFEKLAIKAAGEAIRNAEIDASGNRVLFILSTTKGNVELLEHLGSCHDDRTYLWYSAQLIAQHFGNQNTPIVVSNACISGCAAQMAAERLLRKKRCRYVVVVGADVLSKFVISGFQSFKSLSTKMCKPFDADRCGLNLGEAAATIIYCADDEPAAGNADIGLAASAVCNDANHISAPSRTGEGQLAALQEIADISPADFANAAFVSAHGTATRYNDDMESVALNRAGIAHLPVNSLKGYFGHTLGAAGIL